MFTLPRPAPGRDRRRRRLGFTLIELIVVVIIIAVLAAIAGVAYSTFVGIARNTAVLADAKQVDTAITARSAQEDLTPSALVAQALAPGNGLAAFFDVAGEGLTFTADSLTSPTTLTITSGSRSACLTLGVDPGMSSAITSGACDGTPVDGGQHGGDEPDTPGGDAGDTGGDTGGGDTGVPPTPQPTTPPAPTVNFMAVSKQTTVSTSADGVSWTDPTTVIPGAQSVAYAGDRWFVLGTTDIATSSDGTSWTTSTLPSGNTGVLRDVAGNPTMGWLAVGANQHIVYSADGTTWQTVTGYPGTPTTAVLTDVEVFQGRFYVAGGADTGYYTPDPGAAAPTWTKLTLSLARSPFTYAVAGGKLWTIPAAGSTPNFGYLYSSSTGNAADWTKSATSFGTHNSSPYLSIVGDDAGRMWVSQSTTSGTAALWRSPDGGATWTKISDTVLTSLARVDNMASRGTTLVAAANANTSSDENLMRVTTDNGSTWQKVASFPGVGGWFDVAAK